MSFVAVLKKKGSDFKEKVPDLGKIVSDLRIKLDRHI
jgi:hypothetical protein